MIAIPVSWPKGTYSLIKPTIGCPNTHLNWSEGWRYQDTENSHANNYWSDPLHFAGEHAKNDMTRFFCSKTVAEEDHYGFSFQPGQYCLAKKGPECPPGRVTFFGPLSRSLLLGEGGGGRRGSSL